MIAAGATAGVGIGSIVSSDNNTASEEAANKAAILQSQQAQANQANLNKQEAVLGAQGQSQEQTGGSLTDSGTSALTDLLAGYPGYQGGSSSGSTGVSPSAASAIAPTSLNAGSGGGGTPDIAAILAALRNGGATGTGGPGSSSIFGGNWQPQPAQPQAYQELANPVLS